MGGRQDRQIPLRQGGLVNKIKIFVEVLQAVMFLTSTMLLYLWLEGQL
jgi:hypothetical protein